MIRVLMARLHEKDFTPMRFAYPSGESTMTDENGWIYILDGEGLTIGAHPRDKVEAVNMESQAGETTVISDNPKDGN